MSQGDCSVLFSNKYLFSHLADTYFNFILLTTED